MSAGEGPGREASPRLPVGRVGRPHGLDGSFYVTRPDARLLKLGGSLRVGGRDLEIVRRAGTDARPILRLSGISGREAVEAMRGQDITIDQGDAPALGEGEWWAHELEGCRVVDGELEFGTVVKLMGLPSCEALEVQPARGGATVIVPMVAAAIRRVAPQEGVVDVDLEFIGEDPRA